MDTLGICREFVVKGIELNALAPLPASSSREYLIGRQQYEHAQRGILVTAPAAAAK
jgi:hypothetical protein